MGTPNIFSRVRSRAAKWLLRSAFPDVAAVARWLAGDDEGDGAQRKYAVPTRPYKTEPWVRKAIATRAKAAASVPLVVSNRDGDLIDSGPLVDILASAVRGGAHSLVNQILGQYLLTAESHLIQDLRRPGEGTVDVYGAKCMAALTSEDGYELKGWQAKMKAADGRWIEYPIDLSSIESWIDDNLYPETRFRGLSRIESLALTLAEDRAAAEHNASILSAIGNIRGHLKTEQPVTPQQADELEKRWRARYKQDIAVLGKGTEWQQMVQSNSDLLLLDNRKLARETVLSLFDVPPDVAGIQVTSGSTSGAHSSSTREGFYVNTVWPDIIEIGELLTRFFVPRFAAGGVKSHGACKRNPFWKAAVRASQTDSDLVIWGDMTQLPAMRSWLNDQADAALKWLEAGVPLNDILDKCDFVPYEPQPWGDDHWIPTGQTTAAWQLAHLDDTGLPQEPEPAKPDAEDEPMPEKEWINKEEGVLVWRRWVGSWKPLENRTKAGISAYFRRQEKLVLAQVAKLEPHALAVRGVRDIGLDMVRENRLLIDLMTPQWKAGWKLGGDQMAKELGGQPNPFRLNDDWFKRLLPQRFAKVVNVNVTTQEKLRKQLAAAFAKGENVNEMQARVKSVFKEASYSRSLRIARTESAMSVSQGRSITMKASAVELKGWLTAGDEHVRVTHVAAGRNYRKGIPVNSKFRVGSALLDCPCDPSCGDPGEIVNCRCVLLPINKKGWGDYRFVSLAESERDDNAAADNVS